MAIAVSQGAKGRAAGVGNIASGAITTAAGSTLVTVFVWDTGTFSSLVDSKSNSWTQIGTELTFGTSGRARAYFSALTSTGASHTVTITQSSTSSMAIFVIEVTGEAASPFDKSANVVDATSPFASGLTAATTQAAELITGLFIGNSGSNPATHAISATSTPTAGWAITVAAEETNGASFYTGAIASVVVAATAQYQSAWTETGASSGAVWTATFLEAAGGAAIRIIFPYDMDGMGGGMGGGDRMH